MVLTPATAIAAPVAVAAGASTDTKKMGRKTVSLVGTFNATYQLQISDGTNWINEGAAQTSAGAAFSAALEVTKPCLAIRWNCTAYVAGAAPSSFVVGVMSSAQIG
jgi:hypothetical protein